MAQRRKSISPLRYYTTIGLAVTAALALLLWHRYALSVFEVWLISVNTVTLLFFVLDKALAWDERKRIPEKVLLVLILVGGSPAGLVGMELLRHKVRKASFQRAFWAIVALHILGVCIWYFLFR